MSGIFNSKKKECRPLLNNDASRRSNNKARLVLTASALAFFGTTCVYLSNHLPAIVLTGNVSNQGLSWHESSSKVVSPGISLGSFEQGLHKCQYSVERSQAETNTTRQRHRNPRTAPEATDILIQNGHIWLGDSYLEGGDVYLKNGLIAAVGKGLKVDKNVRVLNAGGRVVTPGIIDMHSHMTVQALNGLAASDDTNEMTSPTTPYVRSSICRGIEWYSL
jgi:hypothetical protein